MNEYRALAAIYDEFTADIDFDAYAGRYAELLTLHGAGGKTVCDIACGTGRLSVGLAKRRFDLICADRSPDMLGELMNNFAAAGLSPPLCLCRDAAELDLYGTVGAFVCTIDGLNHMTDPAELASVFEKAALFLEEPGLFIFDLNTVRKHRDTIGEANYIYDSPDAFAARSSSYDPATHTTTARMDIFLKRSDGLWSRSYEEVSERAYPDEELLPIARAAGFELVAEYDDLGDAPANENTDRALYVMKLGKIKNRRFGT